MSAGARLPDAFSRLRPLAEQALRDHLAGEGPLRSGSRYVLGWEDEHGRPAEAGGKRLRPVVTLLGAEAAGASPTAALPAAVAIELVHNFSLVHDDIQDRDIERHHRPAAWTVWGEAQGINLGDYLLTAAIDALLASEASAERRVEATRRLNAAIAAMIGGQWDDIAFEAEGAVTVDAYLDMVRGKTGALLGAAAAMGAVLGGGSTELADALHRWGMHAGVAFQVRDDELGIWGDQEATGKSNVNDLLRRKKSLPVVLGLQDPSLRASLEELYAQPEPESAAARAVAADLEAAGVRERTREVSSDHRRQAQAVLDRLSLPPDAAAALSQLTSFAAERSA